MWGTGADESPHCVGHRSGDNVSNLPCRGTLPGCPARAGNERGDAVAVARRVRLAARGLFGDGLAACVGCAGDDGGAHRRDILHVVAGRVGWRREGERTTRSRVTMPLTARYTLWIDSRMTTPTIG